jgi:membrane-bound serine protease (ClpP class)
LNPRASISSPRRGLRLLCFAFALLLGLFAQPAEAQRDPASQDPARAAANRDLAVVIPIEGAIDFRIVALLRRGLDEARARGASRVILAIDTPGGELETTREIVSMLALLREGDVDTVAWIRRQGLSAGALIALSCRRIFMATGSTIGAATPIALGGMRGVIEDEAYSKLISAVRADARTIAEHRGETVQLIAEAMVDPRLELRQLRYRDESGLLRTRIVAADEIPALRETAGLEILESIKVGGAGEPPLTVGAEEALQIGLSEGIAENLDGLGRQLGVTPDELERIEPTWSEELADFLHGIRYFLLIGGVVTLLLAIQIPGTGVPEVFAALCFLLFFAGNYLVGLAEWTEILLFVLGVGLVLVEVFVIPGTIISGLAGLIAIIAALFLALQPFTAPSGVMEEQMLESNLWNLILVLVAVVVLGAIGSRVLPRLPFFRKLLLTHEDEGVSYENSGTDEKELSPLVGKQGLAVTDLRPSGKVEVDGEPIDVVSDAGFLPRGSRVAILLVHGNRVVVGPLEETDPDSPGGADLGAADPQSGQTSIELLILIAVFGFVLMAAEIFIPSFGVLSILSALALISSIFLGFQHGPEVGMTFLVAIGATAPLVFWFSFKALPKTAIGRKLILRGPSFEPRESLVREEGIEQLVGQQGVTVTDLRPSGTIEVEGRRWDAMTRGEMLDRGRAVQVVRVEMSQLVVRALAAEGADASSGDDT